MRVTYIFVSVFVSILTAINPVFASPILAPQRTPELESTPSTEYILPYPGMLPDNPIYKLKTARDRLLIMFISSPANRADKYISLADRLFVEALKVAEKDKISLAVHTAFKAEHQMTLAVSSIVNIDSPEQFKEIKEKTLLASQKHRELLAGIADRVKSDNDAANNVEKIVQFSYENDESIRRTVQERQQKELFEELLDESPDVSSPE